ncbi:MAG: asparagine synthase (glutamine-hydrolyzing) [Candidatus Delongbacteria bacterium]|nr:asparagine synthase (glutamine-hydrolyzing) [Candidatus Delongbacteria bacterium]
MCGILGSINYDFNDDLLDLIKHRGPDRQSIFRDTTFDNKITLGQTRLSIVDLSESGNQPMLSECGNYCIIFNGEIYNHIQLREKLKRTKFNGHSDTETVLYYIIEKGIDSIKDFNGIFAFSVYDRESGKLYLARDKYGVKPLYHFCDGNKVLFSSEIRPIKKSINASLDPTSLNLMLNLRYCPSPTTLLKGINKLRPGHFAEIDLKTNVLGMNFRSFLDTYTGLKNLSFAKSVKEYGLVLEQSVERQLMSDVEVGVLLSGGIDSALVAGIASKKLPYKMKAFTVGFDSEYSVNEIALARETADHFGMEHHVAKMESKDFFEMLEKCSSIVEEPIATTSFIPMYYLSKLASEKVKVVLTGQGADELLGGYPRYQGEILFNKYPKILFKLASFLVKSFGTKNEKLIRGANSLSTQDDVSRFAKIYSIFTADEIKLLTGSDKILSEEYIKYYYDILNCGSMENSTARMMAIDKHMQLADDLLLYTDKITMNFSLECRVPMLDLKLVDFLESLPLSYKVKRGYTKVVLKEYAKKFLPPKIINRPKFGFQSPTDIWFRESNVEIRDILLSKDNKLLDYLNKTEIENILSMHKKGYNKEKQIFLLLSSYYWLKNL